MYFVLNSNVVKTIEEANNLFITHNGFFIIIYIRFILVFLYYRYYFNYQKRFSLVLDETSFNNKTLIPTQKAWTEKKNALNSLRRIPHWKNKGYEINDVTYLSLLSVVGKGNNYNS